MHCSQHGSEDKITTPQKGFKTKRQVLRRSRRVPFAGKPSSRTRPMKQSTPRALASIPLSACAQRTTTQRRRKSMSLPLAPILAKPLHKEFLPCVVLSYHPNADDWVRNCMRLAMLSSSKWKRASLLTVELMVCCSRALGDGCASQNQARL